MYMDPQRYQRLKQLFEAVCGLAPAEREAYLARECPDDAELRAEVLELIAADEAGAGDALDRALSDRSDTPPASELPRQIGRYKILGLCGSGGMGTVYEAEQDTPRRRVALKVIQAGAVRPDLLSRFRLEAEILGRLQHPGIAQIYEAGEFEHEGASRPYFAMEFVEGLPLLTYARRHELSVTDRLGVFLRIGEAMHYAHQHGVVHRDLKPDNVFIVEASGATTTTGAAGQPKILDFGVARLADADVQVTLATGVGQLVGSVPYMSPEQAEGLPEKIDARTDVYSLGVMLFELLTGRLPYDVRDRALHDALNVIRLDEPSRLGSADPGLRGDLETIVGKCLEKERERRYSSAQELVDDLRRYLTHEPVHARPPSTWYQMQKFARRNRALVGGALTTLIALSVGLVLAIVFAVRAAHNEASAVASREEADQEAYRANLTAASALAETNPLAARRSLDVVPGSERGWEWHYLDAKLSNTLLHFAEQARGELLLMRGGDVVLAREGERGFGVWDPRTGARVARHELPGVPVCWAAPRAGERIACAFEDGSVRVTTLGSDAPWEVWRTFDGPIDDLAIDPAGERVALAAGDRLVAGRPGAWVERTIPPGVRGTTVAFYPDGAELGIITTSDRQPLVWRVDAATLETLQQQPAAVSPRSLAISPDGATVAIGDYFRSVFVLDGETLIAGDELLGHHAAITFVHLDDCGRLITVCTDDTVRVWDLSTGKVTSVLACAEASSAVTLDRDHILTAGADGLRLWALSERCARVLRGHESYVYELGFSPDSQHLASADFEHGVRVWSAADGELIQTSALHSRTIAFDRQSRLLGSGGTRAPWYLPEIEPSEHWEAEFALCWNTSHKELSLGNRASAPWDMASGLHVMRVDHAEHLDGSARVTIDGRLTGPWSSPPQPVRPALPWSTSRLALGPYTSIAIAELLIYDAVLDDKDAQAIESYLTQRRRGAAVRLPDVSSAALLAHLRGDEEYVRFDEKGHVQSWSSASGPSIELRALGTPPHQVVYAPPSAEAPGAVRFISAHANSRRLEAIVGGVPNDRPFTVLCLGSNEAESWGRHSFYRLISPPGLRLKRAEPGSARVSAHCMLSPDRSRLIEGDEEAPRPALVRDATTLAVLRQLGHDYYGVAFHPDGRRVACGSERGTVDVYDVESGELLAEIRAHSSRVYAVAFSPDGSRLASGGNDNVVRLWDAATTAPLLELIGHEQYVKAVAFSPDGTMLASASGDRNVRIWDSVLPAERYATNLRRRALHEEVRDEVEAWLARMPTLEDVAQAIRERWAQDPERRDAALTLLARATRE